MCDESEQVRVKQSAQRMITCTKLCLCYAVVQFLWDVWKFEDFVLSTTAGTYVS